MMLDPLGPVTIGAREIYDQVLNVGGKVEQVGAKVDGVITEVADHEARLRVVERTDTGDHEARIRALERNRWPLPSLAALVGLAALVLSLIPLLKGA